MSPCTPSGDPCDPPLPPARADAEAGLRERLRTLEEGIATLGHDIRNPLNAIAAAVEVLNRSTADSPRAIRAREVIANQTQRLAATMDRVSALLAGGPVQPSATHESGAPSSA